MDNDNILIRSLSASGELLATGSSKSLLSSGCGNNLTTRLRLENERLRREVSELRRLMSASGTPTPAPTPADVTITPHPDLDQLEGEEKIKALEGELLQTRDALSSKYALDTTHLFVYCLSRLVQNVRIASAGPDLFLVNCMHKELDWQSRAGLEAG